MRSRGNKKFRPEALPVLTVDDEEEAMDLQILFGCRPHAGPLKGCYVVRSVGHAVDDDAALEAMDELRRKMREVYARMRTRRGKPA